MNYLEWNKHIAGLFFNQENAGKEIHFYLTKQDLINQSKHKLTGKSDDEIWTDFICAIKYGQKEQHDSPIPFSPIQRPLELFQSWNKTETPPFIGFLILYIIPLTETYNNQFNTTNYYGKINVFFNKYGILNDKTESSIGTANYQSISHLWNELEEWSIITKSCDLGIFELKKFGNPNWIHVGKPFSQCVLPPSAISKLPELFFEAGFVPNSKYPEAVYRKALIRLGSSKLGLNHRIIELIQNSVKGNELGHTIIDIVHREYKKWTGETHQSEANDRTKGIWRNHTVAPLFLQFKINENEGSISFSYRMYSSNDYPEDLHFDGQESIYEANGWSKTLRLPFKESFETKDEYNKWVARFPEKDTRLFINAGTQQLSSHYWIETEALSKTDSMYLLCKSEKNETIQAWGQTFHNGNFKMEDLEGMPANYSLYRINNPSSSHPQIPILTLYTEKKIHLFGGLKISFRTFIDDFPPEVLIENADGDESVYIQYRDSDHKEDLEKSSSIGNHWILPTDIILNKDFYIRIRGEQINKYDIPYQIQSSTSSSAKIDGIHIPKRDAFGKRTDKELSSYYIGNNITNSHKSSHRYFSPSTSLFFPLRSTPLHENEPPMFLNHCGNMLGAYLSFKNVLTTEEFYKAFEFYYSKGISECHLYGEPNLSKTKRASLNFYDYTGFLDYDYETKKIVVNPPQLIFIPSKYDKKVLLVGGRDATLLRELIDLAFAKKLEVRITKQYSSNDQLFLPDAVTITTRGSKGEENLVALANEVGIDFNQSVIIQSAFKTFSADIHSYEGDLVENGEIAQEDYNWARRKFNPETLQFEKDVSLEFDKSYSLVEYKLNEYTYYNNLWMDNKCYSVDKNWGKYLALKHHNKNVILFDSARSKVAVPITTPLPRLLSKAIILLSGLAPDFKSIDNRYYRVYENIPGIFAENLFRKLSQEPIKADLT